MARVVRSLNGSGRLTLRGGGVLAGRYHVDVSYQPVRRAHQSEGAFLLGEPAPWESVVEVEFTGPAALLLEDGQSVAVTLGGIVGRRVSIIAMEGDAPG
jgi:hypothetical protein